LQAQLPKRSKFDFVEREQLALAADEMKLSLLGRIADNGAVRVGKWVKADLLVLGRFGRGEQATPRLQLEVLDLAHADVLAERTVKWTSDTHAPASRSAGDIAAAAQQLDQLLNEAAASYERNRRKSLIALLPVCQQKDRFADPFMDEGIKNTLAAFRDAFPSAFQRVMPADGQLGLIRFPRANRAVTEAELVLDGLVQSDPDAWQKVADYYVWAKISLTNIPAGGPRPWEKKQMLRFEVNVWDARSQPARLQEGPLEITAGGWPDAQVAAFCEQMVRRVLDVARPSPGKPADETVRGQISRLLVEAADNISGPSFHPWPDSPENRRQISDLIQTLEMACFLDPQNRDAREKLVSHRWGRWVGEYARDPFRFAWRGCDAWGDFVQRFGLGPPPGAKDPGQMISGGVAGAYVHSARLPVRLFLSWNTVPEDVPEPVLEQWHAQLAAEFVRRVASVTNRVEMLHSWEIILQDGLDWGARKLVPDPKLRLELIQAAWPGYLNYLARTGNTNGLKEIMEGIRHTFSELGKPGAEAQLFSALPAMNAPGVAFVGASSPAPMPAIPSDIPQLGLPHLPPLTPVLKAVLKKIPLPTGSSTDPFHNIMPVCALAFFQNKLWISAVVEETNAVPGMTPELAGELTPARGLASRLWVYDPVSGQLAPPPPVLSRLNVSDVCAFDGRLWLATAQGAACFAPATGDLTNFGVADGLTLSRASAITANRQMIIAARGFHFFSKKAESGPWSALALPPGRYEGEPLVLCAGTETVLLSAGSTLLLDPAHASWKPIGPAYGINYATSASNGFWLGGHGILGFIDSKSGALRSWRSEAYPSWKAPAYVGPAPLFGAGSLRPGAMPVPPAQAQAQVAHWFKQFRQDREKADARRKLLKRAKDPSTFPTRLHGDVTALARDGDFLWVACEDSWAFSVLLFHTPTESWVGHFDAPARISRLAVSPDRLWLGFAYGDDRLFEVDKGTLLATPRAQWVSNEVGESELTGLLNALPLYDQGLYAFFSGDYPRAAALLEKNGTTALNLPTLLLLAWCYDDLGLDKPVSARRYLEEVISRFPASPWAQWAQDALNGSKEKSKAAAREASLLGKYDRDHNGFLDQNERSLMERDPAYQRDQKSVREDEMNTQLAATLKRYDRNGDGKLDEGELEWLRTRVVAFSEAAPEMLKGRENLVAPFFTRNFPAVPSLLKQYDANHDGALDADELRAFARDLQKKP
jgi:hypothetical protein